MRISFGNALVLPKSGTDESFSSLTSSNPNSVHPVVADLTNVHFGVSRIPPWFALFFVRGMQCCGYNSRNKRELLKGGQIASKSKEKQPSQSYDCAKGRFRGTSSTTTGVEGRLIRILSSGNLFWLLNPDESSTLIYMTLCNAIKRLDQLHDLAKFCLEQVRARVVVLIWFAYACVLHLYIPVIVGNAYISLSALVVSVSKTKVFRHANVWFVNIKWIEG